MHINLYSHANPQPKPQTDQSQFSRCWCDQNCWGEAALLNVLGTRQEAEVGEASSVHTPTPTSSEKAESLWQLPSREAEIVPFTGNGPGKKDQEKSKRASQRRKHGTGLQ